MGTQEVNKKRCVIITAGPMGDEKALKKLIDNKNDYIISADGGADHLDALGVKADILVGDFDSVKKMPEGVEVVRFKAEKDETDTVLAVMRGFEMGFKEFLMIGGLKGRLDHTFANLTTLRYIAKHGGHGVIADSDNEAYYIENGEISFEPRKDYYISAFALGGDAKGVYERGLKYSLTDAVLDCAYPLGVSNQFTDKKGTILVKDGALLIILSKKK